MPKIRVTWAAFSSEEMAADAVDALLQEHFSADEIRVVLQDRGSMEAVPIKFSVSAAFGAKLGGSLGAVAGGIITSLITFGVIPGFGLKVLALVPVAAILQGLIAGAAVGGLLGALAGLAFWRDRPEFPHELEEGTVAVGIAASRDRRQHAETLLREAGGTILGESRAEGVKRRLPPEAASPA